MEEIATRVIESYLASWWAGHGRQAAKEAALYLAARMAKARAALQPPEAKIAEPHFGSADGAILNALSILSRKVDGLAVQVGKVLSLVGVSKKGESLMAAIDDLTTEVQNLTTQIGTVVTTVKAQYASYQSQIADLQAQVAAGANIDTALANLKSQIVADEAQLAALVPAAPPSA